ncbi:hypothetical protein D7X98_19560 [bacterium 1XD8-76]|nr:hypothetical protein D7X98_19560 [bacterium 1XD8-76]
MQVKTITIDGAGMMTARQGIQEKGNLTVSTGNIFGPEYKVSISQEGRTLSERQTAQAENIQSDNDKKEKLSGLKEDLRSILKGCGLEGDRLRDRVDAIYEEMMRRFENGLEVPADTVTAEKMTEVTNLIEKVKKVSYKDIEIDPATAQDLMQAAQEYKMPNSLKDMQETENEII